MFIRNIFKLVSGTAVAQVLPLAVLPFMTMKLGADSFGVYTLFYTTLMMLGALTSLRFEYAINAARNAREERQLVAISLVLNLVNFIILSGATVFLFYFDVLSWYWLMLPLAVVGMGVNQVFYMHANYSGLFTLMSGSKLANSAVCACVQIVLVFYLDIEAGAYIGLVVGFWFSNVILFKSIERKQLNRSMFSKVALSVTFRRNINYLKFVFPGTFVNYISSNCPIYLIGFFYGASFSGYYGLATRLAGMPTALIGRAIGEVYRARALDEYKRLNNFKDSFVKVSLFSASTGILGFLLFYLLSEWLIVLLFGEAWLETSIYIKILMPMFFLQYLTSPVSYSMMISGRQAQEFNWQLFRFFFLLAVLAGAFLYSNSPLLSVVATSFSLSVSFIIYYFYCFRASLGGKA
ncbi:lipopolysaccharide biosynthesis protein [Alishewanella jeotgali]|uniref:O-antigen translocase n=1 Tax=Alishewanella jeotgali KCTC 22429 TaxID=1129374 RepID=H3ZAY5_9ALTE|nr:oligosaccharide flippase family protein [Alishewanella jeotgali]EHR42099.1 O-antigen translocase [Alishewanella jeotgali KCTC 22429]